jgi:UDPglucose 6-dehydrogenase
LKGLGNQVVFYDTDNAKVQKLKEDGLDATDELKKAINNSDISFICVPTPTEGNRIVLKHLQNVSRNLAFCLKDKKGYYLVVVKSTVIPGTTEKVVIPLLEASGKKVGPEVGICVNPEFLTEVHHSWTDDETFKRDFFKQDRVVIGEFDKKSGDILEELYKPLGVPIVRTDLKTAEMIKYACNCALASRISYWNEIYYVCQKLGINSDLVARVAAMDPRIGGYGTVHGKAFGGKCLPKDLKAFISFAKERGYEPKLLEAVDEVNERIKAEKGVRE